MGHGDEGTHLESRPRTRRPNLPNPNPPSLGCPRSLTPQDLMTSIQLRTRSSSLRVTKSKKLRPMHAVVASRLSLEQYMTVQFTEKRSRMSAVRVDCSGSGSNEMASSRSRGPSRSRSRSELGTGHGGIGFGSFHLCGRIGGSAGVRGRGAARRGGGQARSP